MGTEKLIYPPHEMQFHCRTVKLNNPLMGTEKVH